MPLNVNLTILQLCTWKSHMTVMIVMSPIKASLAIHLPAWGTALSRVRYVQVGGSGTKQGGFTINTGSKSPGPSILCFESIQHLHNKGKSVDLSFFLISLCQWRLSEISSLKRRRQGKCVCWCAHQWTKIRSDQLKLCTRFARYSIIIRDSDINLCAFGS